MTDTASQHPAPSADWERRNAALWETVGQRPDDEFRAAMAELVGELPADDATALFERAAAWDSTGHPDKAVPLYRAALAAGVGGERRRRSVIQLASSLRNLGHADESVALLTGERARTSDHLDDALVCVLALSLTELGREREAVALAVGALAPHLPRYQRSMANYARLLVEPEPQG
ncbi:tetratricopeptide repeat protein [Actinacidiphila epipremni]|uniref:Tetratricopeptide repeat protein n=1 Tax=Actinacidiphila epipremni TaxID=2053013 RepID=A0ABX0ZSR8_9ACTN|nr:tetratricopeptide repeat protein [Actinacidiphila epipremni]NJP47044.1 tetratricopeptide repeat protein [Actinacidiphila epipremni]